MVRSPASAEGTVILASPDRELLLTGPDEVVCAHRLDDVLPCLARVEAGVSRGLHAAGFIAYEAAPAFDAALAAHPPGEIPLLWFGLYRWVRQWSPEGRREAVFTVGSWSPQVPEDAYLKAIRRIRAYIAAGDVYQVNYTFPLHASFEGDSLGLFGRLCRAQSSDYCVFVNAGRFHVLSASPEMFFDLEGDRLTTRPMKGTRPRGRWPEEDLRLADELARSDKDQAENVMIVDLLRNDLGRIAEFGTVEVEQLFRVERYPTVWQLTSTIAAKTQAPVPEILRALFPCGSVTGAPKVRMMQIARELEPFPRGVYCGCVGWWFPGRRARFNVAIRTVVIDTVPGTATYGVGGGITWGSSPEGEYEECRVKTRLLMHAETDFELLESILFDGEFFLLDEHLDRLAASAAYFDVPVDRGAVAAVLERAVTERPQGGAPLKVRLLVAREGKLRVEVAPATPSRPVRLGFAGAPVDSAGVFLFHKTTHRRVYEEARRSRPECDDVLLWNERGEITESSTANVVLEIEGELLTPRVECGLLPGTFRRRLLEDGAIREAVLRKEDVAQAASVRLINSVRKWIEAEFVD